MFNQIPQATKHLLFINCIVFLLQQLLPNLSAFGSLNYVLSPWFHFWQPFTYMFLHGSLSHLFFNMFALWMFGMVIENTLGTKRFVIYYLVSGLGAALCQEVWQTIQLFMYNNPAGLAPTVGASGAIYAILLAFGMLYPNQRVMLLIPPIPLKAKYLVAGFIIIEVLSLGVGDNVAHFAHLGGAFVGWLILRYWRKKAQRGWKMGDWSKMQRRQARKERFTQFLDQLNKAAHKSASSHSQQPLTPDQEYQLRKRFVEERIDAILEKVRNSGYESLTQEEKDFLFNHSNS